MPYTNIEIKARCKNPQKIRDYLLLHNASFKGTDHQTDTYFNVPKGRLKLRQGNIENNLIYYERNDRTNPKTSRFHLVPVAESQQLLHLLTSAFGILTVVKKKREIYYINNVKFHIDELETLGTFMEIEAGNVMGETPQEELTRQCQFYMQELGIVTSDLVNSSYSDFSLPAAT